MASAASKVLRGAPWTAFWIATVGFSAVFAFEAAIDISRRDYGALPLWRATLLALHTAVALPLLAIAPFQFSGALRSRFPRVHRWLGRLFLSGAIAAALSAIALGATIDMPGIRISLVLLGVTLLFCATAAWLCARAGDYANHRKFAIRTFALAFAFVWVRVLRTSSEFTLGFIEDPDQRAINREWLSLVLPLLLTEAWLSWWPALRSAMRRRKTARGES